MCALLVCAVAMAAWGWVGSLVVRLMGLTLQILALLRLSVVVLSFPVNLRGRTFTRMRPDWRTSLKSLVTMVCMFRSSGFPVV